MMPVIQPLTIRTQPRTEYQKEQARFAELQVELRQCKRARWREWSKARRILSALRHGLSRRWRVGG